MSVCPSLLISCRQYLEYFVDESPVVTVEKVPFPLEKYALSVFCVPYVGTSNISE